VNPADLGFEYELRRSARARNVRITVGPDGVVVVLPERAGEQLAHDFVLERRSWIEKTLARLERDEDVISARTLRHGERVPYLGQELELRIEPGAGRVFARPDQGWIRVRTQDDSRDHVAALLERWYRRRAREEIETRLDTVVALNGTSYSRVAIRDQRSRWGSCSSTGTMNFNWRLMLAPEAVLDYVIEHEAAHIEVRDHSQRFWSLLDERMPDWPEWRDWLRKHGGTLRLV
jgi:hypothetical protein